MNFFVTFFQQRQTTSLFNGFSFGVEKSDDNYFVFIPTSSSATKMLQTKINEKRPKRIFCSLFFRGHLQLVRELLDERWVLGGPLVSRCFFEDLLPNSCKATVFKEPIEYFFGKEISGNFSFYFEDFIKPFALCSSVIYSLSLGFGCYWRKCIFCTYQELRDWTCERVIERPSVSTILSQQPVFEDRRVVIHTCVDCLTPNLLKKVLEADKKLTFFSFIRPDKEIIEILEQQEDLSNQKFSVGLEAPSQQIIDKLNKGFTLEDFKKLVKVVVERKGKLVISIMESFPFTTSSDILEAKLFLNDLEKIVGNYGDVFIFSNGKMDIPEKVAKTIDKPFEEAYKGWYHFKPQENSQDFVLNNELMEVIKKSPLFRG